jgi:three-Cys-motif partner protein
MGCGQSAQRARVQPPYKEEFHFIDADGNRPAQLKDLAGDRPEVFTYEGDCNDILPSRIFPRAEYSKYGRALCLLDPYNIDLAWNVVASAGKMGTIEIFLNFMIKDMNMNVLLALPPWRSGWHHRTIPTSEPFTALKKKTEYRLSRWS